MFKAVQGPLYMIDLPSRYADVMSDHMSSACRLGGPDYNMTSYYIYKEFMEKKRPS